MGLAATDRTPAVALTAVVLLVTALVVYVPKLRLGGGIVVLHGRTIQGGPASETGAEAMRIAAELSALMSEAKAENQRLQEALKAALASNVQAEKAQNRAHGESGAVTATPSDPTNLQIDLSKFLGPYQYLYGVSYDPYVCFAPLAEVFPNATEQLNAVKERIEKDLLTELAKIHGISQQQIDPKRMYHMQDFSGGSFPERFEDAVRPMVADDKFQAWREAITRVAARYMCSIEGYLHMECDGLPARYKQDVATLGQHCRDVTADAALAKLGYVTTPFNAPHSIATTLVAGTCFTHVRDKRRSFAHWIVEERMTPEWQTFVSEHPEQDKVLLLFDMLYEKLLVFTRQYWMGVITMQNPFDMYSIQDIIYTTKPDLLIETGTANGGSAVLWSGIMELVGLEHSRIITIDVQEPTWDAKAQWGGAAVAREDPTKNKMWQKRVTFIKGYTNQPHVLEQVKAAAQGAKSILVTLDSGHDEANVAAEMAEYCPYVTVGSYCIVEDTKMSRWHSTGPLGAVKQFLATHPEFEMDRKRELLYTHHAMGYLKRIK